MKYAFVDTETTGTNPTSGRVIEIAVILYQDDQIIDTFHSLINPQVTIDPFITKITGINSNDLTNAPAFEDIALTLRDYLDGATIVAHNARFDYAFIRQEFRRLGIRFTSPILCTVRLSRKLYPQYPHHNLDAIIHRFGFTCPNRHRALDDARVLVDFFNHLKVNIPSQDLEAAIHHLLGHPSRPLHVSDATLQNLPDTPGVYIFYSQDNSPLYVGKSLNLRSRILSHFYDSLKSSKEMNLATFTYDIKTISTAGELSALLLESRLIKELQPAHNRLLRLKKKIIALFETISPSGYYSVETKILDPSDEIYRTGLIYQTPSFLGIFKSRWQAENYLHEIADKHQLCPKILGLDNSKNSCFSYHLGKCKGACQHQENPLFYNLRHQSAFQQSRLKRWPFEHPVLITESNADTEISRSFLVDQWCILSEFDQPVENCLDSRSFLASSSSSQFDLDTYKILFRFIMDPKNQSKIRILKQ